MIQVTLPDGSVKEFESGTTPFDVANSISAGLARNVISAKYNNKTIEITTPLTEDGALVLFTWNDDEGKKAFWHSSAHILAQALEELYPGVKLTIGPAIDKGFYYDPTCNIEGRGKSQHYTYLQVDGKYYNCLFNYHKF